MEMDTDVICSEAKIAAALKDMRSRSIRLHIRLLVLGVALALVAVVLWNIAPLIAFPVSIVFALILVPALFFVLAEYRSQLCPLCNQPIRVRRLKGGVHLYSDLTRSCLNCGLRLDGSNVREILDFREKST
jgi:hypothetical protein